MNGRFRRLLFNPLKDEYITTEKQQEMIGYYLEKYNFEPLVSVYEGGHSFDAEKLAQEIATLEK